MVMAEVPALADVRGAILKTVEDLLKSVGEGSRVASSVTAGAQIEAAIKRSYGHEVAITVVRADKDACAATVRFEGRVGGIGDRESIRFRRNGGGWEKDRRMDMYATSIFPFSWP